jgi:FKBP-type peptidyl-prolyl cis-trans isomerase
MKTLFASPARFAVLSLLALTVACKGKPVASADGGPKDGASAAPVASGLPAPPDVAAPPADAVKQPDGLASKVLEPGTGTDHPLINDEVKVNYTGWTTDGKMFDSSVHPLQKARKPEPVNFGLAHVIPGWTEGLQLMVVGEKRRLWIPEDLAYKGKPGQPAGMLVFDVELLGITPGPKPPQDVAAPPADAEKLKDDIMSKVIDKGTGKVHPQPNDGVKVVFSAWQHDGRMIDSSKDKPTNRPVTGFYDGWADAVQSMVVGEKRVFWIPSAVGPKGRPGSAPTPDVTVVIELQDILAGPKTPSDVKAVPKDAVVEKDGLASKILTKGTGTVKPGKTNSVTVQYAGWTTDGKMFDSSFARGEPATFGVGSVIPGWTEILQEMVEGEKRRVWIPEELAYKGKPSGPQGMLVFEIELQKIGAAAPPRPAMGHGPPGMGGGPGMGGPPGGMPGGMPPGMGGRPGMPPRPMMPPQPPQH